MCLISPMLFTFVLSINLNQPIDPTFSIFDMLDEDDETSPTVIRAAFMQIRRQYHPDRCRYRHPDATEEQIDIWENNHKIMENVYRKYAENPNAKRRNAHQERTPPKANGDLAPVSPQQGKARSTRNALPYILFSGAAQPIASRTLDALFNDGQPNPLSSKTACMWHSSSKTSLWCSSDCPGEGHMWEPIAYHSGRPEFVKGLLKLDIPSSDVPGMPLFGSTCMLGKKALCCRVDKEPLHYDGFWFDTEALKLISCIFYTPKDTRLAYHGRCGTLSCKKDNINMIVNITGQNTICNTVLIFGGYGIMSTGSIDFYAPDTTLLTRWLKIEN